MKCILSHYFEDTILSWVMCTEYKTQWLMWPCTYSCPKYISTLRCDWNPVWRVGKRLVKGHVTQKLVSFYIFLFIFLSNTVYHILCVSSGRWLRLMCSVCPCWSFRAALKKKMTFTWKYGNCLYLFYNRSYLLPRTRPGSQMKGTETEKQIKLKRCGSLCSWQKFYLWFLRQLCVYTPVDRCSPFFHSVMPEVIIISENLNETKVKEMSPVCTWKIPPASHSIRVQACTECK